MRKYGRRARLGRRGGLVISKYEEYVHDCATECPDGHKDWRNLTLYAEEVAATVPAPSSVLVLRIPWDFGTGRL